MLRAEDYAAALVVHCEQEWYVVGRTSDIQRLNESGFVDRAWEVRLDNGHRPYMALKKRIDFEIDDQPSNIPKNGLTSQIMAVTGTQLAHPLHLFEQTYLLRRTPAFWSDVFIFFRDDPGEELDVLFSDFYAVYQGRILYDIQSVKLARIV